MVICLRQSAHQLNNYTRSLLMANRKRGKIKHIYPMFDNEFLASSKQIKPCPRDFIIPIKQENIWDYNPLCCMFSGLMLDDIIMNLFTDSIEQTTYSVHKHLFYKLQDDKIHLYKRSLQDFTWKKNADTKNTLRSHHLIEFFLRKHLSGILSIDNDDSDLEMKTNQSINDIRNFNNKHIIECKKKPISNIPEKPRYK